MTRRYIFADTETTGAKAGSGVVEVGWVETDADFNIISQIESLIDPQQPISPSASGVHGLIYEDVQNSPTLDEFFSCPGEGGYGDLLRGEVVIVGHRISFDTQFLAPYIPNLYQEVCTLRWARKLWPDIDDHKLSTLKYARRLPRGGTSHRVMADIMDAYYLTKDICEELGMTLAQLTEASKPPMLISICPFGKHKGEPMSRVPRSYLGWMINNMDLDYDMKFTVESLLYKKN